jgi:hypothetical protein
MVPSRSPLLGTGVSVTQPGSGNRSEPPIAGCRLGTMVRSRERIRVRLVHRIGCPKHGIRSGSSWISGICCPRLYWNCGQSCSTRPGDPWPTGTDRAAASCRSSRQLRATPSSNFLLEITGLPPPNYRIEVLRQPLASTDLDDAEGDRRGRPCFLGALSLATTSSVLDPQWRAALVLSEKGSIVGWKK